MSTQTQKPLRSSKVAIVGAGIAGYAAAAALAQSGFTDITIIESQSNPFAHEPNRAYSLVIDKKGQGLINKLTGFQSIFAKEAFCQQIRIFSEALADGTERVSTSKPEDGPLYWILKYRLLEIFDKYIKETYPKVVIKMATSVEQIQIPTADAKSATSPKLILKTSNGTTSEQTFDLVLACDGFESTIHKQAILNEKSIRSSNGMSMYSKDIGSTGIRTKGIVLDYRPIVSANGEELKYAESAVVYKFNGSSANRPKDSVFDVLLLPVSSGQTIKRRATLALPEGHKILSISKGEEMLQLFRENFPHLPVDEIFPVQELDVFAKSTASSFPPARRPNSLVGYFPNAKFESGLAFVGDSAHTLPLDTAQGSNSALKDVETMLDILADNSEMGLNDFLAAYEKKRDKEAWALVKLAPSAAPYQYKQNMFRFRQFMLNKSVRSGLAGLIPFLFSPDLDTLMRKRISYQEARRRNRLTTLSMVVLLSSIISVPLSLAVKSGDSDA